MLFGSRLLFKRRFFESIAIPRLFSDRKITVCLHVPQRRSTWRYAATLTQYLNGGGVDIKGDRFTLDFGCQLLEFSDFSLYRLEIVTPVWITYLVKDVEIWSVPP